MIWEILIFYLMYEINILDYIKMSVKRIKLKFD